MPLHMVIEGSTSRSCFSLDSEFEKTLLLAMVFVVVSERRISIIFSIIVPWQVHLVQFADLMGLFWVIGESCYSTAASWQVQNVGRRTKVAMNTIPIAILWFVWKKINVRIFRTNLVGCRRFLDVLRGYYMHGYRLARSLLVFRCQTSIEEGCLVRKYGREKLREVCCPPSSGVFKFNIDGVANQDQLKLGEFCVTRANLLFFHRTNRCQSL